MTKRKKAMFRLLYHTIRKNNYPSFPRRRMVVGGDPFYLKFRAQKRKSAVFSSKIALLLKKVCYKVSLCEDRQRQSCRAFIGLTIHVKIIGSTWNFKSKWPRWSEIADFPSIFVRSASTVTPSEKSSINTHNRKSTIRAFRWPQDEHRIRCP